MLLAPSMQQRSGLERGKDSECRKAGLPASGFGELRLSPRLLREGQASDSQRLVSETGLFPVPQVHLLRGVNCCQLQNYLERGDG